MNKLRTPHKDGTMGAGRCATVLRMCSDFCNQMKAARPTSDAPLLNVALAYENPAAAARAFRLFQNLFDADENLEFKMHNVWKFDFLRIDRLREAAIAETACADLVIISMNEPNDLPGPVKTWIETSLRERDGDPGALVLLHEGQPELDAPKAEIYLSECSQKSGLDFFVKRASGVHGRGHRRGESDQLESSMIGVRQIRPPASFMVPMRLTGSPRH